LRKSLKVAVPDMGDMQSCKNSFSKPTNNNTLTSTQQLDVEKEESLNSQEVCVKVPEYSCFPANYLPKPYRGVRGLAKVNQRR
jgi:hypothetical protein